MKKIVITTLVVFTLISLGACTNNNKNLPKGSEETSMSSKKDQATDETSNTKEQARSQSIFTAILVEDAKKNDTVDHSIRLVLKEVEAVEDPEKIITMMKNDGVILNVPKEQLADGITESDLKSGNKIQFTLVGLPAMTMSIPPQVAGNSVIKIEKI
ncbi:hypothetical protein [Enterococcus caccae]|uniref:Lipoprotein n=1 Tax=Enterococcus caccae ATCC BAA-1240 TaxID=1158612 RepID=R3W745_9ENTE|nr:hypothetical protein [Enterococcus caccae]EOL43372.1 hypothetical protein UC7_02701 [Enterococcus caccae ATCC BAA-1240]EOT68228.1 hypothetical protein I580_00611 [Enterococcus caccae ATCC BAA-1240]